MTRDWDSEAGRREIDKLRRDNAVMRRTLEQISTYCDGYQAGNHAEQTLAECDAPLTPTVEQMDAIAAGVEQELHGKTGDCGDTL